MSEAKDKMNLSSLYSKKQLLLKLFLPLFVSLGLIIFAAYFLVVKNYISNNKELEKKIIELNNVVSNIENSINKNQSNFLDIQNKLKEYQSQNDVLSDLVAQPIKDQFDINIDYALLEIEYLLTIANHNLLLVGDYQKILLILSTIENRLNSVDMEDANKVKQDLRKQINILKSNKLIDRGRIFTLLSNLSSRIDYLPLKNIFQNNNNKIYTEHKQEKVQSERLLDLILEELKNLVVISHSEKQNKNNLSNNEISLIKLKIKLELANAKFFLLNISSENFNKSIHAINSYLKDYYDLSNQETLNFYDELSGISEFEIFLPNIDVMSLIESVRAIIRYQIQRNQKEITE